MNGDRRPQVKHYSDLQAFAPNDWSLFRGRFSEDGARWGHDYVLREVGHRRTAQILGRIDDVLGLNLMVNAMSQPIMPYCAVVADLAAPSRYYVVRPYYERHLENILRAPATFDRSYLRWVLAVAGTASSAISTIHSHDIAHGDVRLQNLFDLGDGQWRLGDFALDLPASDELLDVEQLASVDAGADLTALGVMLETLLAVDDDGAVHPVLRTFAGNRRSAAISDLLRVLRRQDCSSWLSAADVDAFFSNLHSGTPALPRDLGQALAEALDVVMVESTQASDDGVPGGLPSMVAVAASAVGASAIAASNLTSGRARAILRDLSQGIDNIPDRFTIDSGKSHRVGTVGKLILDLSMKDGVADHERRVDLGIDGFWRAELSARATEIALTASVTMPARIEDSRTPDAVRSLMEQTVSILGADKMDESRVRNGVLDRLTSDATELRVSVLGLSYLSESAIAEVLGPEYQGDILRGLAALGAFVAVRDHGELLLPAFQFEATGRKIPLVFGANTVLRWRFPSFVGAAQWILPRRCLDSTSLADCLKSGPPNEFFDAVDRVRMAEERDLM